MRTCTALSLTALRRLASHSPTAFNYFFLFFFYFSVILFVTVMYRSWEQKWEGQRYFLCTSWDTPRYPQILL